MLKLLFNRFSRVVTAAEVAGTTLIAVGVVREPHAANGWFAYLLLALTAAEYIFIRFCASKSWYKNSPRYSGIETHFKKVMVATSYVMLSTGVLLNLNLFTVPLVLSSLLLLVIVYVNSMLISHHLRDTDSTPPNFFSKRLFCRPDQG